MIQHTCMTKAYLLRAVRRYGAREILGNVPEGATDADMLQRIEDDPREYFVVGACDNQLPDGQCGGHP